MIKSYRDGVVPACPSSESELSAMSKNILERVDEAMNNFAFDEALKSIWEFISRANKFIDETSPWKLAKEDSQAERLDFVLLNLYEALRLAGLLIAPVMPDTAKKIYQQLGIDSDPVENLYENFSWGQGAGNKINKAEVLFPRIDINEWKKSQEAKKLQEEKETSAAPVQPEHEAEISIDDFKKVEMRVARVLKVEEIPKSKKLYKLEVDLGYETRTVCSGIKAFFTPEELVGKKVILVTNLKPVKLCGVESNGMILCASVKKDGVSEQLTLITPEKDIPLGSRVS